jgi:hypothetical protein
MRSATWVRTELFPPTELPQTDLRSALYAEMGRSLSREPTPQDERAFGLATVTARLGMPKVAESHAMKALAAEADPARRVERSAPLAREIGNARPPQVRGERGRAGLAIAPACCGNDRRRSGIDDRC